MEAIRVAQNFGLAWEQARPERRHEMLDVLFESVTVGGKRLVSVKPRDEVAPLFAVKLLQSGGPDRIRTGDLLRDRQGIINSSKSLIE